VKDLYLCLCHKSLFFSSEKWKRRWLILNNDGVWYYESVSNIRQENPIDLIPIEDIVSVKPLPKQLIEDLGYHKQIKQKNSYLQKSIIPANVDELFAFSILQKNNKDNHLVASSKEIMFEWIEKLNKQMKEAAKQPELQEQKQEVV